MRAAWPRQLALVKRLHDAGVLLTAGSDLASPWVIPGIGFHQELELLESAGLSPTEVLRIATLNGARALGVDGDRGSIAPGQRADLVVLGEDPRRNIRVIRKIRLVIKAGVIHSPAELHRN
jgi:imidazolonepropionase-like amidohydrolase